MTAKKKRKIRPLDEGLEETKDEDDGDEVAGAVLMTIAVDLYDDKK